LPELGAGVGVKRGEHFTPVAPRKDVDDVTDHEW
jgi:hypothetical protein